MDSLKRLISNCFGRQNDTEEFLESSFSPRISQDRLSVVFQEGLRVEQQNFHVQRKSLLGRIKQWFSFSRSAEAAQEFFLINSKEYQSFFQSISQGSLDESAVRKLYQEHPNRYMMGCLNRAMYCQKEGIHDKDLDRIVRLLSNPGSLTTAEKKKCVEWGQDYQYVDIVPSERCPEVTAVQSAYANIYRIEDEKKNEIAKAYRDAFQKLENGEDSTEVKEILNKKLEQIYSKHEEKMSKDWKKVEVSSAALASKYNTLEELDEKNKLKKEIIALEEEKTARMGSTHTSHLQDRELVLLGACFERACSEENGWGRSQIISQCINFGFSNIDHKNIPFGAMQSRYKEIESSFLKWGKKYANDALAQPIYFQTRRDLSLRESKQGNMHPCVTVLTPQLYRVKEHLVGIPSGLRTKQNLPANVHKTETYIVDRKGTPIEETKKVAFRAAQFPTEEAAKTALKSISQDPSRPYIDIMVLTPSFFGEDRALVERHFENVTESVGDKSYLQAVFGVNEYSQGETFGIQVGWHTANEYNNPFFKKLNDLVYEYMKNGDPKYKGAVVALVEDIKKIWMQNDYMDGSVGDNQVKMPGLLRALGTLIGADVNIHCRSAKDRGSLVEAYATEVLFDIEMAILDGTKQESFEIKTSAFEIPEKNLGSVVDRMTMTRGIEFQNSTTFILNNDYYSSPYEIIQTPDKQRTQRNRRYGMRMGLLVTSANTGGVPGVKVKGKSLDTFYAGFSNVRVKDVLQDKCDLDGFLEGYKELISIETFDIKTQVYLLKQAKELFSLKKEKDDSYDQPLENHLKEVKKLKRYCFKNVMTVKS